MASKLLNNDLREQFVNSVMADIDKPDFDSQINDLAQRLNKILLPPAVAALIGTEDEKFLHRQQCAMGGAKAGHYWGRFQCMLVSPEDSHHLAEKVHNDPVMKKLVAKADAHEEKVEQMKNSLMAIAKTCRTVDQLKARFPELEKYIPSESKSTNLPADANLMSELSKLGWPKD